MSGICEGRVVIITGAGGGLGAAHAKVLASEGASVVVNDINEPAATKVVEEIVAAGGKAVVNTSDITNYDDSLNAVKQALDSFGDLHAVVNNAGINRDRMFASMTEEDWDLIMAVHLKGHFCISSHAVHYWRGRSKEGSAVDARIINTSSGAGLQGSIGQSNYAAAKAGIAALTLNQAAELATLWHYRQCCYAGGAHRDDNCGAGDGTAYGCTGGWHVRLLGARKRIFPGGLAFIR